MDAMARFDAIVLGAGIVGTSVALHLTKRGLSVALIDLRAPGEQTSYGNAGVIEGNTLFPPVFPSSLLAVLRVALKRATEANYHLAFLPHVAPWLLSYRLASRPKKLLETARVMRPLFNRAVAEHEALLAESNAAHYMCKTGWLKVYRSDATFAALAPELALAAEYGIPHQQLDFEGARALEPNLGPVVRHAVQWSDVTSVSNPLAVTRAYAARFAALGGALLSGDARSLRCVNGGWRVDTMEGPRQAGQVVLALGPFTGDVLEPLGLKLPLGIKRGYHLHFQVGRNVTLTRPVLDADIGYCLASMAQGIRLTTGAEFAHRDAPATPVQFDRLMPAARALFPLGEQVEAMPWMGSRPCFADSRPVIGPAPGLPGLWLAYGHAHWGLTLGPATGRLIAEMMTAAVPFCDPKPYGAERFLR